jgi:prepilin peptidase CpaA
MFEYPLLLVFPAAMIFAAAFDLFTMTIPNKISISLLVAFVLVAPLSGLPLEVIGFHLLTGFGVLVAGFLMFTRGWIGGGDAKLLAAAALWLGFDNLLGFGLMVGVLGGFLSLSILAFRTLVPEGNVAAAPHWLSRLHAKDSGVPYGLAIGAAALLTYPDTRWYTVLIG